MLRVTGYAVRLLNYVFIVLVLEIFSVDALHELRIFEDEGRVRGRARIKSISSSVTPFYF